MTFWSSQRIEANLSRQTNHADPSMIDCNALTLRVGGEVYITPGLDHIAPSSHTKRQLGPNEPIAIPPGQFAFLLTEETITIPKDVMGLISIKATYKLKGLVNVSGFHVDPGWTGQLIFTVFNAGPATIHLQRSLHVFLLWIADLDAPSQKFRTKVGEPGIPPAIINNITGVLDSIYALEKRVKEEIKAVGDKQESFRAEVTELKERQHKILLYFGITSIIAISVLSLGFKLLADHFFPAVLPIPIATAPSAQVTPLQPQNGQAASQPTNGVAPAAEKGTKN